MSGDADIPSSPSSSASTINHSHDNTSTTSTSNTTSSTDQTTRETTPPRTTSQDLNKDPSTRSPSSSPTSTTSPRSSPSQHSSNQPPSRRVKVYKLKDDAWVDLGTGTCQGVLIQQNSPPGDMEVDLSEQKKEKLDPAEEGAWIVVKREKVKKEAGATGGSSDDEGENQAEAEEDDDDDDEKNVILKTRVQPYPPGYSEDFDEEELVEGEDGQTLDVGGYQRQQDTLIVWTERGDGDEEMEMALSFATSTGCAEMWEFIKAARRFTGERRKIRFHQPR